MEKLKRIAIIINRHDEGHGNAHWPRPGCPIHQVTCNVFHDILWRPCFLEALLNGPKGKSSELAVWVN